MTQPFLRKNLPEGDPFPVASGQCSAKMDQNEAPVDLPQKLKQEIADQLLNEKWTRYPQPSHYQNVKEKLALTLNVHPDNLAITNGCDGAIQGAHFLAGGCGRTGLGFAPSYPMLNHAAWLAGTKMTVLDLGPEYKISDMPFEKYDLVLIANPNNPTGNLTDPEIIEKAVTSGSAVFLDEAYYDFSGVTKLTAIEKYPNLMIGRSFSKSMLGGLRLGVLLADQLVIRKYESLVTAPYHLSHLHLIIAGMYRRIEPYVREHAQLIIDERRRIEQRLDQLKIKWYPSVTNFILFKIDDADQCHEHLLNNGIRIRKMTSIRGLNSHLRVTVGTPQENDLFLNAMTLI